MCAAAGAASRAQGSSAPTLVALKKASALISAARSAAAVSVVKKGLPVPAPKMTTRPCSRWRIARRLQGSEGRGTLVGELQEGSGAAHSLVLM